MIQPTFIIAGEAKAGTTVLDAYLRQHPDVFVCSDKEPRYFSFRGVRPSFQGPMDEAWFNRTTVYEKGEYYHLFDDAVGQMAVGEASPVYIHIPDTAQAIFDECPDIKIIILIRNPVEVAYSAYQHMIRNGYEPLSFSDALNAESSRINNNWAWHWRYTSLGYVSENIRQYLDVFPRDQLLFINYDDFKCDNAATLRTVCDFIAVSPEFPFQKILSNTGGLVPRFPLVHRVIMNPDHWLKKLIAPFSALKVPRVVIRLINKILLKKQPRPDEATVESKKELRLLYKEEIKKVSELTGLSLEKWIS